MAMEDGNKASQCSDLIGHLGWRIYLSWSIDSTVSFTLHDGTRLQWLVNIIMLSASQGRRKQFLEMETVITAL